MTGFARLLCLIAAALCLSLALGGVFAQGPGKDFQPVTPPQPVETGNKIEVIEFFSYGCPHCKTLEEPLRVWLKRKPADVELRRVPVIFNETWAPYARIYYTIESMGLVDKLHRDVFTALHDEKVRLQDPKVLFDWVATKGVDKQRFMDTFNSFSVVRRTQLSPEMARRYSLEFTPALVIDGRYLTGPSMVPDYDQFFKVVDQLIAVSRKMRAAR